MHVSCRLMTKSLILRVRASESGIPLADFISRRLNVSGKKAKACLDARCVFVNGIRAWMARHKLRVDDEVSIVPCPAGSSAYIRRTSAAAAVNVSMILFSDADYLIVNKPPGITTDGPQSLESMLGSFLEESPSAEHGACRRPLAVHRLDRDTSGCVIFARTREAKRLIIPLFAGRAIFKAYHVIVKGRLAETEFMLTKPMDGKTAVTRARVLDANKLASHVLATIETGRTHQIRKHFGAIHHPVLGDRSYAGRRRASPIEMMVPRQMLHAFQVRFKHPVTGRIVACEAPIPKDFRLCLKQFGLT